MSFHTERISPTKHGHLVKLLLFLLQAGDYLSLVIQVYSEIVQLLLQASLCLLHLFKADGLLF